MFICKLELHLCREWKYFNYEPRTVRFACEVGSLEGKDVGIKLSQFSSANVPKVN
jgi:general transcription factor 3C polypeptide 2